MDTAIWIIQGIVATMVFSSDSTNERWWNPHETILKNIEPLGTEVLPLVRKRLEQ